MRPQHCRLLDCLQVERGRRRLSATDDLFGSDSMGGGQEEAAAKAARKRRAADAERPQKKRPKKVKEEAGGSDGEGLRENSSPYVVSDQAGSSIFV